MQRRGFMHAPALPGRRYRADAALMQQLSQAVSREQIKDLFKQLRDSSKLRQLAQQLEQPAARGGRLEPRAPGRQGCDSAAGGGRRWAHPEAPPQAGSARREQQRGEEAAAPAAKRARRGPPTSPAQHKAANGDGGIATEEPLAATHARGLGSDATAPEPAAAAAAGSSSLSHRHLQLLQQLTAAARQPGAAAGGLTPRLIGTYISRQLQAEQARHEALVAQQRALAESQRAQQEREQEQAEMLSLLLAEPAMWPAAAALMKAASAAPGPGPIG